MRTGVKIFLVLAAIYACLLLLEAAYGFGLKHNQNNKLSNSSLVPKNAGLLVHGPCEPLWMISPALLDQQTGIPSYNLALSHSDFADNYLHLYLYLKHNKAPDYIFLYITPESMDRRYNTFNSYRFAPYLDDQLVMQTVRENDPEYARWCFIPFMCYAYYSNKLSFDVIQGYKHYFTNRKEAYYPDGFEPPTNRVWGNHAAAFAELYDKNTVFDWDPLRETYLLKTIRLAKERDIHVYLYESPIYAEALAWQPNRKEMIARIRNLAAMEDVPFIQFEGLEMAKDKNLFISTLNFNMEGLKLFNDTLGKYICKRVLMKQDTAVY
jgi:hypothetical protein